MADVYVPPNCLADARRVLDAQDPDAAKEAEQRWPGRVWRAAMKAVTRPTRQRQAELS